MDAQAHRILEGFAAQLESLGWPYFIDAEPLRSSVEIDTATYLDGVTTLEREGYLIAGPRECSTGLPLDLRLTPHGFRWALDQVEERSADWTGRVLECAKGIDHSRRIAEATGVPEGAVKQILDIFEDQGLVQLSKDTGGWSIYARNSQL